MSEGIRAWEIAGNVAQRAYGVGSFVIKHLKVGGWGETATDIQPEHINVDPELGQE